MAWPETVTILDADGVEREIAVPVGLGRVAAAAAKGVALSSEDFAVLSAMALEATQQLVLDELGTQTTHLATIATAAADTAPAEVFARSSEYETVAASVTDQMMGTTGAVGDTIDGILVIPSSTTVGAISIEDGSTNTTVYAGGTVGADLKPFFIPLFGIASVSGGWEITTGVGASALVFGRFT